MGAVRDNRGRFTRGHPGGPGRPSRAVEVDYLHAMRACVSQEDWQRIVARAVADALKGDARAREWLSLFLLPAPHTTGAGRKLPGDRCRNEIGGELA